MLAYNPVFVLGIGLPFTVFPKIVLWGTVDIGGGGGGQGVVFAKSCGIGCSEAGAIAVARPCGCAVDWVGVSDLRPSPCAALSLRLGSFGYVGSSSCITGAVWLSQ